MRVGFGLNEIGLLTSFLAPYGPQIFACKHVC